MIREFGAGDAGSNKDNLLPVKPDSQAQIADRIKCTLTSYQLSAQRGLLRLAKTKHALSAIDQMRLTETQLDKLIASCAQAIQNRDKFFVRLAREKAWAGKAEEVIAATQYLKEIIEDLSKPDDSLSAYVGVDVTQREFYFQALNEIVILAKARHRVAKETPGRIGATRKSQQKKAAENAAIGWLAASIKRITGSAHTLPSCYIAEALLGIKEIPEARLRGAVQNVVFAQRH